MKGGSPTALDRLMVFSRFTDQSANPRPTLADYVDVKGVYPAGRLDMDSEGLLALPAFASLKRGDALGPGFAKALDQARAHLVQIGAQPAQLGQQFLGTHRHNLHENQRGDPCTQEYRVCPDSPPLILLARNGAKRRSVPVPAPAHMTSRRITVFDEASLHLVLRTHGLAP